MFRKCISITVVLCLMVLGNYALGAVPWPESQGAWEIDAWHGFQDDWHNSGVTAPGLPATKTDGNNWHDPAAWSSDIKNAGRPGPRPPDSTVWACIEPKTPGPNVWGDVCCVRLSLAPWSYAGAPAGAFITEFNSTAGDINCGLMIGLADKVDYDSVKLNSYPVLNMYGGRVFTPGCPNVIDWNTTPPTVGDNPAWWDGWGLQIGGGEYRFNGTGPCYGTVNMYAGMMDLPKIKIYYGDVNLYGGLLYHNDTNAANFYISQAHTMNRINIEGGELRLKGDRQEKVWYYYEQGDVVRICPCKGHGRLYVDYNGTDTSVTAVCTPGSAWDPAPRDHTGRTELNLTLSWKPGPWVKTPNAHAVYFGTDFNDVNTCGSGPGATSADYNSDSNELTVHIVFSCEDNLEVECNSTDDINDFNTTTLHWTVDSIITKDGRTYLKLIRDEIGDINEDVVIKHLDSNDRGMCGHILLTAGDDVFQNACCTPTLRSTASVCSYKGRQDPCTYTPGLLISNTTYYWRIDEYNDTSSDSPWKGNVWWFHTKGPVSGDPRPANGTVGLSIPLQLSWSAGALTQPADGHAVYFGTDLNDVNNSTSGSVLPGVRKYTQTPTTFPLSTLDYNLVADTNYYWRVDEINTATAGSPWKGEVWKFTNTNYFIVDNFETYDGNEALLMRWKTGYNYNSCTLIAPSGKIGWMYDILGEGQGNGAMQYDYDDASNPHNSYYFSEVRFDANGLDWTGGDALPNNDKARSLAISYIGGPRNDADPNYDRMYVKIEDTAGHLLGSIVNISNPEAQRISSWQRWDVNLYDLNSTDVNLKSVKYLYLGFGKRCNATGTQGGKGTVRFDDIRLYQQHCVPAYTSTGDLTGDCRVDVNDFNIFADQWLAKQTQISPVKPPDANLVLWYKFDETNGRKVRNWGSCADCNGKVDSNETADTKLWSTGGYDGNGCLNLKLSYKGIDYNTFVEANVAALGFVDTKNALTFSIWVNADIYMPTPAGSEWPRLICVFQDMNEATDENEVVEIECPTPRPPAWDKGPLARFRLGLLDETNEVNSGTLQMSDFGGGWNHYAFVENVDANWMRIYHNGELIAETNDTNAPMFGKDPAHPVESFRLGKRRMGQDAPWIGKIDDFRVYDYALSQAEVAYVMGLMSNPSYVPSPFKNVANLKTGSTPEIVNFGDYAILAQQWLNQKWWP